MLREGFVEDIEVAGPVCCIDDQMVPSSVLEERRFLLRATAAEPASGARDHVVSLACKGYRTTLPPERGLSRPEDPEGGRSSNCQQARG